jgi:hypothetical protein
VGATREDPQCATWCWKDHCHCPEGCDLPPAEPNQSPAPAGDSHAAMSSMPAHYMR